MSKSLTFIFYKLIPILLIFNFITLIIVLLYFQYYDVNLIKNYFFIINDAPGIGIANYPKPFGQHYFGDFLHNLTLSDSNYTSPDLARIYGNLHNVLFIPFTFIPYKVGYIFYTIFNIFFLFIVFYRSLPKMPLNLKISASFVAFVYTAPIIWTFDRGNVSGFLTLLVVLAILLNQKCNKSTNSFMRIFLPMFLLSIPTSLKYYPILFLIILLKEPFKQSIIKVFVFLTSFFCLFLITIYLNNDGVSPFTFIFSYGVDPKNSVTFGGLNGSFLSYLYIVNSFSNNIFAVSFINLLFTIFRLFSLILLITLIFRSKFFDISHIILLTIILFVLNTTGSFGYVWCLFFIPIIIRFYNDRRFVFDVINSRNEYYFDKIVWSLTIISLIPLPLTLNSLDFPFDVPKGWHPLLNSFTSTSIFLVILLCFIAKILIDLRRSYAKKFTTKLC
jgi:hypothetical protein